MPKKALQKKLQKAMEKKSPVAKESSAEASDVTKEGSAVKSTETVVTIEACKQCEAFKTRATKISKGVGSKAKVEINKDKPGKGNFVVKVSGIAEPIVELLQMKRPFPPLKALNMDDVVQKVLNAIEA